MSMTRAVRSLALGITLLSAPVAAIAAEQAPQAPAAPPAASEDMGVRLSAAGKLVAIMHLDRQLDRLMPQLITLMMGSLVRGNTGHEDQIRQILGEEFALAFKEQKPAMMNLYRETYARHLTLAELEAMTTFYASDVGQSVLAKMPELTQDSMQSGAAIGQKAAIAAMPRIIQRMQAANLTVPKGA